MALQFSVAVRNAMLDAIETTIGASAVLKIRSGSAPITVATADSGTILATLSLPADWMNAASTGTKTLLGSWTDATADNSGTAAHFRIYASDGTTQHFQGTVGTAATDMIVDSVTFTAGQSFTVNSFTLTAPGA